MRGQRGEPSYLSVSDTLGGRSSSLFSKYKVAGGGLGEQGGLRLAETGVDFSLGFSL